MLLFWRAPEVPRLQKLNTGKTPKRTKRSNGLSRRLKENNQKDTIEMSGSR